MDPKKVALLVLSKKSKAEDTASDDEGGEPKMPPLEDVMGDFIAAVNGGDAKAAAKAFRAAQACASDYDDTEDGGDAA